MSENLRVNMWRDIYERSRKSEPSIVKLIVNQSEHLSKLTLYQGDLDVLMKKFVFKKISTIEIPKSLNLHRYVITEVLLLRSYTL